MLIATIRSMLNGVSPVFSDELPDFQGPLSGMLTALEQAKTDFVLLVPCDSPYFPQNLLEELKSAVKNDRTLIALCKRYGA